MAKKLKDITMIKINPKGFDPKKYVELEPTYGNNKNMVEEKANSVVITFGRFSPPTTGHEKLVAKITQEAKKRSADPLVYASHTFDKKKNPLSYLDKMKFLKTAFGSIVKTSDARSIIEVAKELSGKYDNLVVVVGQDRIAEFERLLNNYNGKEYNFKKIEIISAGERDPDADDVSGMSASKLRSLAVDRNFDTFKTGLPKKLQAQAKDVYNAVLTGMGLMEDTEIQYDNLEEKISPLTFDQRVKRSMVMRRYHAKIEAARARARNRRASPEKLKDRSRKKALVLLRSRISKSKAYGDMSASEKIALDQRLSRIPQSVINRIALKQLPIVRKKEAERMSALHSPQNEDIDVDGKFEVFLENFTQESSINENYYAGLSKSTAAKRKAHFKKGAEMSDENPAAYEPAPGDARAKTKPSVHTKRFHQLFKKEGTVNHDLRFKRYRKKVNIFEDTEAYNVELNDLIESMETLFEGSEEGLKKKAEQSGIAYGILKQVYDRGVAAWRTGHRPGTNPSQWGFARVNSFATKGKGTWGKADSDLAAKVRKEDVDVDEACWTGYEQIGLKKKGDKTVPNCVKEETKTSSEIKKGDWILVSKKEHSQVSKYGDTKFTYGKNKIPASSEKMYVDKITTTKDGRKAHLRYKPDSMRGYSVMLDQLPDFMDLKVLKEGRSLDMAKDSIQREKEADKVKHKNILDTARTADTRRNSLTKNESSEVIQKIISREKKHKDIAKALKSFSDAADKTDKDEHSHHAEKIIKSSNLAMNPSDLIKLYHRIKNSKHYEKAYSAFDAWESVQVDKNDPKNREDGTDSLVRILKADTPGEAMSKMKNTQVGVAFESVNERFESFLEGKARGFEDDMIDVPNVNIRTIDGKLKSFPSGKSSSSDGGNGE